MGACPQSPAHHTVGDLQQRVELHPRPAAASASDRHQAPADHLVGQAAAVGRAASGGRNRQSFFCSVVGRKEGGTPSSSILLDPDDTGRLIPTGAGSAEVV